MYVVVFFISFGVMMDIVKKDESAIKNAIKKFSMQRMAIYYRVSIDENIETQFLIH